MASTTLRGAAVAAPALDAGTTLLQRRTLAVLRLATGFIFLWAFLDKTFGLGFSTPAERAWLNGGTPAQGFLNSPASPGRCSRSSSASPARWSTSSSCSA